MPRNTRSLIVQPFFTACALASFVNIHADSIQPYAGCGVLSLGAECVRFAGDDGVGFSMPSTLGFNPGDYVYVEGEICDDCPSICQDGAVFTATTIAICVKTPPNAFFFSECGTIIAESGGSITCRLFRPDRGGLYLVENLPLAYATGSRVRITTNDITFGCLSPCAAVDGCINDNFIELCEQNFDMCGLVSDYSKGPIFNCTNFVGDDGNAYLIGDLGPYEAGNRARIIGAVSSMCPVCGPIIGCVYENEVAPCFDITGDALVNVDDLLAVIAQWGRCIEPCVADIDGNDAADVDDLLAVITNWSPPLP